MCVERVKHCPQEALVPLKQDDRFEVGITDGEDDEDDGGDVARLSDSVSA